MTMVLVNVSIQFMIIYERRLCLMYTYYKGMLFQLLECILDAIVPSVLLEKLTRCRWFIYFIIQHTLTF